MYLSTLLAMPSYSIQNVIDQALASVSMHEVDVTAQHFVTLYGMLAYTELQAIMFGRIHDDPETVDTATAELTTILRRLIAPDAPRATRTITHLTQYRRRLRF